MASRKVVDEVIDESIVSSKFDTQFEIVEGLTWYPWVGTDYEKSNRRVLIVGESHYNYADTDELVQKYNAETVADKYRTRKVIQFYPIRAYQKNVTYENLHRILFSTTEIDREAFWKSVSFYNFIQRPMDYSKTKPSPERPSSVDIEIGWKVFKDVIQILQPTDCIFVGVLAADAYKGEGVVRAKLVGSARNYAREFAIKLDNKRLRCTAIRHTSRPYGTNGWHEYLKVSQPELMTFLESNDFIKETKK